MYRSSDRRPGLWLLFLLSSLLLPLHHPDLLLRQAVQLGDELVNLAVGGVDLALEKGVVV